MTDFNKGDAVTWKTPQGETSGKIIKEVTSPTQAGSHTAKASPKNPEYEVKTDKSGKTAIHKPNSLHKIS